MQFLQCNPKCTNSAFDPSLVGKRVVIHVITQITRERKTRTAYGCLVAGLGPWARA